MSNKVRRKITAETYDIVSRLLEDESTKFKDIAKTVDLCLRPVTNILKKLELGTYKPSNEKIRQEKNNFLEVKPIESIDLIIKNLVACNNDTILNEIKGEIYERTGKSLSLATICRKLKNLMITRKRLSLIPEERNC